MCPGETMIGLPTYDEYWECAEHEPCAECGKQAPEPNDTLCQDCLLEQAALDV